MFAVQVRSRHLVHGFIRAGVIGHLASRLAFCRFHGPRPIGIAASAFPSRTPPQFFNEFRGAIRPKFSYGRQRMRAWRSALARWNGDSPGRQSLDFAFENAELGARSSAKLIVKSGVVIPQPWTGIVVTGRDGIKDVVGVQSSNRLANEGVGAWSRAALASFVVGSDCAHQ